MNYGVGGVRTGLRGSRRTPVQYVADMLSVPTVSSVIFPTQRFINEGDTPVFIEKMLFYLGVANENTMINEVSLGIAARGEEDLLISRRLIPVQMLVEIESSAGADWGIMHLRRPLVLLPGEALIVEVYNADSAAREMTVGVLGYRESMPAPQKVRYLPHILYDRIAIDTLGHDAFSEEALRVDGLADLTITDLFFIALGEGTTNHLAFNDVKIKLGSTGVDWMDDYLDARMIFIPGRPLPVAPFVLPRNGALSAEVQNDDTDNSAGRFDYGAFGYREIPFVGGVA